ncbi:CRISPR-associated endonuclease Cas2 [Methanomethylovorans sp.]|uniref:CRISPR-associated endonuclease Cas2 n=1 Tax=Methanomethylovorans sp. TaxID=2758717 RepID=UPI00345E6B44
MGTDTKYVIVAYDIENNGKRSRIAELLLYHGLVRIQYSVFAGEITARELKDVTRKLFDMELEEDDNITIIPICMNCKKNVWSIKPLPEQIKHLSI